MAQERQRVDPLELAVEADNAEQVERELEELLELRRRVRQARRHRLGLRPTEVRERSEYPTVAGRCLYTDPSFPKMRVTCFSTDAGGPRRLRDSLVGFAFGEMRKDVTLAWAQVVKRSAAPPAQHAADDFRVEGAASAGYAGDGILKSVDVTDPLLQQVADALALSPMRSRAYRSS